MTARDDLVPDYSYLSTYRECERKHYWAYERELASSETVPVLHAGTAGHAGLETLFMSDWDIDATIEAMRDSWGDYRVPPQHDHSYLSPGHLEVVLKNFAETQRSEFREVTVVDEEQLGEAGFVVDWDGTTVGGRIDLVQTDSGGLTYVVDHKFTTAWLNKWWAAKRAFDLSHQLRLYAAAAEKITGRSVAGAYISGVYMGEKAADPPEKWENRKSQPFKLFGPFTWSRAHLAETKAWIDRTADDIERAREREEDVERPEYAWPQNTANRWGCGNCEFHALCEAAPGPSRDSKVEQYVRRERDGRLASGADSG